MSDCIFCKIASGEIKAKTLYEDEEFRVILDLGPATKGHALILPKIHAENIYELSDELIGKAFTLGKKIMLNMKEIINCTGYNIVQNNGVDAGQTVFHFHIHLIPRYEGDDAGVSWDPKKLHEGEAEEICQQMIKRMK